MPKIKFLQKHGCIRPIPSIKMKPCSIVPWIVWWVYCLALCGQTTIFTQGRQRTCIWIVDSYCVHRQKSCMWHIQCLQKYARQEMSELFAKNVHLFNEHVISHSITEWKWVFSTRVAFRDMSLMWVVGLLLIRGTCSIFKYNPKEVS